MLRKISYLMHPKMLQHCFRYIFSPDNIIKVHRYGSNDDDDDYEHQKMNPNAPELKEKWPNGFKEIFERHVNIVRPSMTAICMRARKVEEVRAGVYLGLDAVRINLVAFPPLGKAGDVHNLDYVENSFDLVFSNIFDPMNCEIVA